jgi:hypothetical protein
MSKSQHLTIDASARSYDAQGFLHVDGCNISKATVNPYLGAEIPNWETLGLDPKKTYYMHRPAAELEKAASTANMIPLMDAHIEVSAFDLMNPDIAEHQVGTTGETAELQAPYLINSLCIWKASAIQGVMSKEQTELSCAYRYTAVMTEGNLDGQHFDGEMHDIKFNHVAIVVEGRAGPDVTVADSAPAKVSHKTKLVQAMAPSLGSKLRRAMDTAMAMDVIRHIKGHKDSSGKAAPWVIKSETTGKVLWSGGSKEEAVANLRRIKGHGAHAKDNNDPREPYNQDRRKK